MVRNAENEARKEMETLYGDRVGFLTMVDHHIRLVMSRLALSPRRRQ